MIVFFKDEADLAKHAWYKGNSGDRTHPVGLLQAMVIDGKAFYDLYGNVWELGWDRSLVDLRDYGKNPVSQQREPGERLALSGGYNSGISNYQLPFSEAIIRYNFSTGFRLVRTINQGDGEQSDGK